MIYKNTEIELPKTGNILLWVSGGLDSALGLYVVAKHIKENKLKNRIVVATWKRDSDDNPKKGKPAKDWNVKHAEKVVAKVKTLLKISKNSKLISDHIIIPTPPKTGLRIDESEWQKVYYRHEKRMKLKGTFGFVTKNPARPVMKEHGLYTDDRPAYRDGTKRKHNSKPWQNYDKQWIARQFEAEGLMKTLYPVTRSCEGQADVTKNFTKPCEKCWWCREKYWAFNQY